jgi:hypothetical protein
LALNASLFGVISISFDIYLFIYVNLGATLPEPRS